MFGSKLSDPLLRRAASLGFEVTSYTPRPTPWTAFIPVALENICFLLLLGTILFGASRLQSGFTRGAAAVGGIVALLLEPYFRGRSGLMLFDFGMPALAMLGFLHIVDVFFLRPVEEVHSWSFARTFCQIFAFPKEKDDGESAYPRWENVKGLGLCFVKYLGVNILLYATPSPDIWAQIRPLSTAYFLHSAILSLCVLGTLGFLIEGILLAIGIAFGIEGQPMFQNPLQASNIRDFWARWNLAIKDGLSRVFFHFKAPPSSKRGKAKSSAPATAVAKKVEKAAVIAQAQIRGLKARARLPPTDYLSETEVSEVESPSPNGSPPLSPQNGRPNGRAPAPRRMAPPPPDKSVKEKAPKKKSSFYPKALAAMCTFLASGLFHEYMNHLAFDGATGETLAFFFVHGAATIFYSYLSRSYPGVLKQIPFPLAVAITNVFAFASTPLFCAPFLRAGFFEDFKAFGMFGPVHGFVWLLGDGHGRHEPRVGEVVRRWMVSN